MFLKKIPYKRRMWCAFLYACTSGAWGCFTDNTRLSSESSHTYNEEVPAGVFFKKGDVSGQVWYVYVPTVCHSEQCFLAYEQSYKKPVRGCVVMLVEENPPFRVFAKTHTDHEGFYTFQGGFWVASHVHVVVQASLEAFPVYVRDNTLPEEPVHTVVSSSFAWKPGVRQDVVASSGWLGGGYTSEREAAPFAVVDVLYEAYTHLDSQEALSVLRTTPLDVYWSSLNQPQWGYLHQGDIGTTHWDLRTHKMYVLGAENTDTDEYDAHVIAHEWAHAMESFLARSDSKGGPHGNATALLDPRLAFSEGFADAVAGLVLNQPLYTDTMGMRQQYTGYAADIENNAFPLQGWYSEGAVRNLLYDLGDTSNESFYDTTSVGVQGLVSALMHKHAQTPAFTSVFSFLNAFKDTSPFLQEACDISSAWNGVSPVQNEWAEGETHHPHESAYLPVFQKSTWDTPYTLHFVIPPETPRQASLGAHKWMYLALDETKRVSIKIFSEQAVVASLYQRGELVSKSPVVCWDMPCEAVLFDQTLTPGFWVLDIESVETHAPVCDTCSSVFKAVVRVAL